MIKTERRKLTLFYVFPPAGRRKWLTKLDDLTDMGCDQFNILLLCCLDGSLNRFIPVMQAQVVGAPMYRQQVSPSKIKMGLNGLLRVQMNVRPVWIITADFHQGQVKGAKAKTDLLEMIGISRVSTGENPVFLANDRPGRPERPVNIK